MKEGIYIEDLANRFTFFSAPATLVKRSASYTPTVYCNRFTSKISTVARTLGTRHTTCPHRYTSS